MTFLLVCNSYLDVAFVVEDTNAITDLQAVSFQ